MTVANSTPQSVVAKDGLATRKRRRRAPAGGAADDCFTCSKRNLKCDRRRPYCSQCLEIGNECSGYKTQLTWGVGVASRGKLRGLSLPIAKAPPVAVVIDDAADGSAQLTKASSHSRARSTSAATPGPLMGTILQWNEVESSSPQSMRGNHRRDVDMSPQLAASLPTNSFHHGYALSQVHSADSTPGMPQAPWAALAINTSSVDSPQDGPPTSAYARQMPHLITTHPADMLSASVETMSEMDYMPSPLSHSFPRDDASFAHSPAVLYDSYAGSPSSVPQSPAAAILIDPRAAPTSCPSLVYAPSEPSSSLPSHMDAMESHFHHKLMHDPDALATPDMDVYSTSAQSTGQFWGPQLRLGSESLAAVQHGAAEAPVTPMWPSVADNALSVSPELVARMPFFMDYYENTMCPSMVFIDGPNNPFRDHVLQLAADSQSLRHAICALAACNLRMKRKLSLGQHERALAEQRIGEKSPSDLLAGEVQGQGQTQTQAPDDQSLSEEYQHRNLAVRLLNEQLNDPTKSRHDSVLATILLLCHYRMAESGIARFHTQFAGVKKILGMRRAATLGASRDSAWMEALFTYFDAISASINDRECQLNTSFYGVMPDAQLMPPGSENLVGCDRDLFKTIIKLGRLNLLSQHRPVQSLISGNPNRPVPNRSQSSSPALGSGLGQLYGSHHRYDGNGFGSTLDDDEALAATLQSLSSSPSSSRAYDDHRSTFWKEWKDARIALQSWEFDSQRLLASLQGGNAPTPAQVRDLGSLSEAFRYAALLYTERLASPVVPSGHNNFRNLVSQVVYYATSLEAGSSAEKFLLWPLFVAGSECVNELQQNMVRSKCRDIMARSGYMNNLAALDVLERLWAGDWKEPGGKSTGMAQRGPFSWTRCIGGPGVEVEWIMF